MPALGFTWEEFKARRSRLCERLGKKGLVLLQGAPGPKGSSTFEQYNDFFYLSGLEVPHAYLLLDAKTEKTTAYLPQRAQLDIQSNEEPFCAENAERVCKETGLDAVRSIAMLGGPLSQATLVHTPMEDGQPRAVNRHHSRSLVGELAADPWDTRLTRSAQFIDNLRRQFPRIEVRDLSKHLDEMRLVKSPAEVAMLRRAGKLCAQGVVEAMRATEPGVIEYQLDAVMRYHYLAGGATDKGYHAIVASGPNIYHGHYSANNRKMENDDWVLVDCAPDYRHYTSDIGRMWPVNGTYSPWQRALYGFVVEYHKALLAAIRPGRMKEEIHAQVAEQMAERLKTWPFATDSQREGARRMLEFKGHISHSVGMSVHDGSGHYSRPLQEGMVFSVDPQCWIQEEKVYVRCEDTIAITADGIENLTSAAPLELDETEAMVRRKGMLQAFPAV